MSPLLPSLSCLPAANLLWFAALVLQPVRKHPACVDEHSVPRTAGRDSTNWYSVLYTEACTCKQPVNGTSNFYFVKTATTEWAPISSDLYQSMVENGRVLDLTLRTPECQAADMDSFLALLEQAGGPAFFCSGLYKNVTLDTCNGYCRAWMQSLGLECLESQPGIIDSDDLFNPFTAMNITTKDAVAEIYTECLNGRVIQPRGAAWAATPGVSMLLAVFISVFMIWGA